MGLQPSGGALGDGWHCLPMSSGSFLASLPLDTVGRGSTSGPGAGRAPINQSHVQSHHGLETGCPERVTVRVGAPEKLASHPAPSSGLQIQLSDTLCCLSASRVKCLV